MLKLGFIGGGLNSAIGMTHWIASQMDGRWKVVCGAFSRNREINQQSGVRYQVSSDRVYDSWRVMIEHEKMRVDAIAILTPTPEHLTILIALLKYDIPIICEKTLVTSLDELSALRAFYDEKKHFLRITYNYTAYPMLRELRERIQRKEMGKLLTLNLEMPQETFLRTSLGLPQSWRLRDQCIPTLALDLAVHLHHLAYYITGLKPLIVLADWHSYSDMNVVDDGCMLVHYQSGVRGQFWFSKVALGEANGLRVRVYSENEGIFWHQMNPEFLEITEVSGRTSKIDRRFDGCMVANNGRYQRMKAGHPAGFVESFANLYSDLADELILWREGSENITHYGIDAASDGLLLLTAAAKSVHEKRWVRIDEI